MSEETRTRLTRRQALTAAGTLGASAAPGRIRRSRQDRRGGPVRLWPRRRRGGELRAHPSMTEGPYFVDELLKRSDVRASQAGVPLER